jgi:hypothetical protein
MHSLEAGFIMSVKKIKFFICSEPEESVECARFIQEKCPNLAFVGLMTIGDLGNSLAANVKVYIREVSGVILQTESSRGLKPRRSESKILQTLKIIINLYFTLFLLHFFFYKKRACRPYLIWIHESYHNMLQLLISGE